MPSVLLLTKGKHGATSMPSRSSCPTIILTQASTVHHYRHSYYSYCNSLSASSQRMDSRTEVPEISPLHVTPSTSIYNEVCEFQKGIKCDITLYHIFKDDRQNDSWYCKTHTIDTIHGTKQSSIPIIALQKLLKLSMGSN